MFDRIIRAVQAGGILALAVELYFVIAALERIARNVIPPFRF